MIERFKIPRNASMLGGHRLQHDHFSLDILFFFFVFFLNEIHTYAHQRDTFLALLGSVFIFAFPA